MNGTVVKNQLIFDFASGILGPAKSLFASTYLELNSDAIKLQELYYLERQHMNFLDKQRCGNFIAS